MTYQGVGAGLLFALIASSASAQEAEVDDEAVSADEAAPDDSGDDEARIHFEAGRLHFEAGRYEEALTEFLRAYESSHRFELLYNIGLTQERLGSYGEAADSLEEFNQSQAEPDATLTERVANLRLRAEERAQRPEETQEPDEHQVSPPEAPADTGGGVPMGAIVSYIAAGVGLATFGVFGSLALAEDSNLAGTCGADMGRTCTENDVSNLKTFSLVADIGLGVAALGAIVGTVFLLIGGDDDDDGVAVAPALGPNVVGLSARGTF